MVTWLCLVVLVVSTQGLCPLVECTDLQEGVCARGADSTTLEINSQGCPSGTACFAQGVNSWWQSLTQPVGATIPCLQVNSTVLQEPQEYPYYYCGAREDMKSFASGATVIECDSDADCVLEDTTLASCACGLRSDSTKGYCQPSLSSTQFEAFWASCFNQFTQDYALALYHTQTWRLFPFLQHHASCTPRLFADLQIYSQLLNQQVTAAASILVLFSLIHL